MEKIQKDTEQGYSMSEREGGARGEREKTMMKENGLKRIPSMA